MYQKCRQQCRLIKTDLGGTQMEKVLLCLCQHSWQRHGHSFKVYHSISTTCRFVMIRFNVIPASSYATCSPFKWVFLPLLLHNKWHAGTAKLSTSGMMRQRKQEPIDSWKFDILEHFFTCQHQHLPPLWSWKNKPQRISLSYDCSESISSNWI